MLITNGLCKSKDFRYKHLLKAHLLSLLLLAVLLTTGGCADDFASPSASETADDTTVEAYLSLSVGELSVASGDSRAAEPSDNPEVVTDDEKSIDDIWVFQYDATSGNKLINAAYYKIENQDELKNLKVLLKDGVESNICVVANTGNPNWVKSDAFNTYAGLKAQTLPNPEPIKLDEFKPIPMEGEVKNVTVAEDSSIEVPVTRMFAKLVISFGNLAEGMSPYSIEINSIPDYCRVESLGEGLADESAAAIYDTDTEWITRSFNADSENGKTRNYVLYVPENLQGESSNSGENDKSVAAPGKAIVIKILMKYKAPGSNTDSNLHYTVYPGGNTYNNFNIRRNNVYRIKININSANQDTHTPSSNCFVVIPGRGISFEPYNRTETGGGYKIEDYLDPNDDSENKKKVIDRVEIIWQTKDAIGNNENGDKVWYVPNEKNPKYSKIYVKTNKEGNALIGAYNKAGDVIWSWHIWITDNDPGNVGNAIVYTTYSWDSKKIYSRQQGLTDKNDEEYYKRVSGYAVMPCNLGAMANSPYPDKFATYGLLYQWGRKDPFPQMKKQIAEYGFYNYDGGIARIQVFDNSNSLITMTTDGSEYKEEELFKTRLVNTIEDLYNNETTKTTPQEKGIRYSISNPTVFIAAATKLNSNNFNNASLYYNEGDWLPGHDEKLWGALPMEGQINYKVANDKRIWKTYGDKKSIFDPCPSGWRVPPGDLWLGLTYNGLSITHSIGITKFWELINCADKNLDQTYDNYGYTMYMENWHEGKTCFFPTQGSRLASGQPMHGGRCGNYHNATSDIGNRVNTLHFHKGPTSEQINIFEPQLLYHVKAVAGPIRCVRDTK